MHIDIACVAPPWHLLLPGAPQARPCSERDTF
jgi:hypothetical protein